MYFMNQRDLFINADCAGEWEKLKEAEIAHMDAEIEKRKKQLGMDQQE